MGKIDDIQNDYLTLLHQTIKDSDNVTSEINEGIRIALGIDKNMQREEYAKAVSVHSRAILAKAFPNLQHKP